MDPVSWSLIVDKALANCPVGTLFLGAVVLEGGAACLGLSFFDQYLVIEITLFHQRVLCDFFVTVIIIVLLILYVVS